MIEESSFTCTIVLISLVLFLLYYLGTRKPKGYPPGPKWLPIVGSALEIARLRKETGFFSEVCNILSKKYGPIIGLKIGIDRIVILNDYESMKAMIMNENCDGKPMGPVYDFRTFGKRLGLLVVDGHLWTEQRRFIIRHLRDLGFGRTDMAVQIEYEVSQLVKYYEELIIDKNTDNGWTDGNELVDTGEDHQSPGDELSKKEKVASTVTGKIYLRAEDFYVKINKILNVESSTELPGIIVDMENFFGVPVLNTLWCMMAGKRYNVNDEEVIYLQKIFTNLLRHVDMFGCLFNHFPYLMYLAPEMSGYKRFMETHLQVGKFIQNELENHKKTFDSTSPRDLMDIYFQVLQSESPGDTFSESQLLAICMDLFIAGSETTAKALGFGFLFLVLNPEVQKKAQQEIDSVIGRDRLPTLNDRPRLTYINAVVLESIRMFMGRTMNIPHRAIKDTNIMGYNIPKDTMLVVNFNRILMNEFWGDPEEFRPDRFIDPSGKLVMPEQYLPFSFGKHACMGAVLAKSNMFMITAGLLQKFTFTPVPGEAPPRNEYIDGVTASPKPFRVLMTKRT